MTTNEEEKEMVISDLRHHLKGDDDDNSDNSYDKAASVALPVAAIKVLLCVIKRSKANTMMGLQDELKSASDTMLQFAHQESNSVLLGGRSHIALASGCELFLRYDHNNIYYIYNFETNMSSSIAKDQTQSSITILVQYLMH